MWTLNNKLPLNISKCKHIKFTKKRIPLATSYKIDGVAIEEVLTIRDLGVVLDSKLTFKPHIEQIVNKSFKMLGFIWRNCKQFKNIAAFKILYNSLVRSNLDYCSSVWNPHFKCDINRLERVQKRFLFLASAHQGRLRQLESYESRLAHFRFVSLTERRWTADQVMLFKIVRGYINCPHLLSQIGFLVPRSSKRLDGVHPFAVNGYRTNIGFHSSIPRICRDHNKLFTDTKIDILDGTLQRYKKQLLKYLYQKRKK